MEAKTSADIEPHFNSCQLRCGACHEPVTKMIVTGIGWVPFEKFRYCPWCGRRVKWEETEDDP